MEFLYEQSNEIFDEAIKKGILSSDTNAENYVGMFMYMYTIDGVHYFKHIQTRKYGYDAHTIVNACEF